MTSTAHRIHMLHPLLVLRRVIQRLGCVGVSLFPLIPPCYAQKTEVAPYSLGLGKLAFDRDTVVRGFFLRSAPVLATIQEPYTIVGLAGERLVVFACSIGRSLDPTSDYSFLPLLFVIPEDSIRGGVAGTKARALPGKDQGVNYTARRVDVTLPTSGRYLVVVAMNSYEFKMEGERAGYILHLKRFAPGDLLPYEDLKRSFDEESLHCN